MADPTKKSNKKKVTRKILKFSLETNDGIVARTSRELGISRQYIYRMIKKWKLGAVVEETRTRNEDIAMDTIRDNMDDVDVALKYMSIQARKDSAISKQKITVEDQSGVKVTVENVAQADSLQNFMNEEED